MDEQVVEIGMMFQIFIDFGDVFVCGGGKWVQVCIVDVFVVIDSDYLVCFQFMIGWWNEGGQWQLGEYLGFGVG